MKKELDHFHIGNNIGANQDEFSNIALKIGGCAIVTLCDTFITMVHSGFSSSLIPIDPDCITMKEYESFAEKVKPYLHPRLSGIYKISTYTEGVDKYLSEQTEMRERISISSISGDDDVSSAEKGLIEQIDHGVPVVYLLLHHKDKVFSDFEWHWFLINGYDNSTESIKVQIITYGESQWVDFKQLWNTGKKLRGGMVLLRPNELC